MGFPKDFLWGVACASYQVEGGAKEGGRTPSVWDTFSHTPSKTYNGHTGDVACDFYHRYAEDIELISGLGVGSFRFSISWNRILPEGRGKANGQGLDFYDRVVDLCLEKGLEPSVTLFHWDLPQVLEDKGGWLNRDTTDAFAELADVFGRHFAGRVKNYSTLNEPQCPIMHGYANGVHAPGKKLPPEYQFYVAHNLNLAHGKAALALRAADPAARVGVASTGRLCYPFESNPANLDAAREETFRLLDDDWYFTHQIFLDPVVLGRYPAEAEGTFMAPLIEAISDEDLRIIHQKPDFIGLNIYNGHAVDAKLETRQRYVPHYEGFPRTGLKWPITPEVLRFGVNFIYERYQLPLYIMENGLSCNDIIFLDGQVHDAERIDFLQRYLSELRKTIDDGTDLRGYYHWSFTDNFEWHSGYDDRFGLVYIDYPTQRRIPKDSYYWYKGIVADNGDIL